MFKDFGKDRWLPDADNILPKYKGLQSGRFVPTTVMSPSGEKVLVSRNPHYNGRAIGSTFPPSIEDGVFTPKHVGTAGRVRTIPWDTVRAVQGMLSEGKDLIDPVKGRVEIRQQQTPLLYKAMSFIAEQYIKELEEGMHRVTSLIDEKMNDMTPRELIELYKIKSGHTTELKKIQSTAQYKSALLNQELKSLNANKADEGVIKLDSIYENMLKDEQKELPQ